MKRSDPSVPPGTMRELARSKRNQSFALLAARAAALAAGLGEGMRRWLPRASLVAAALALAAGVAIGLVVRHYEAGLPGVTELKTYQPSQVTRILRRDGVVLAELYTQRRTVVSIQSLPPHVKLAVLAAEDAGFYEHEGLNYLGIARAMLVNLRSRSTRQGGSTITQQVVKNLLLATRERTFARKVREALLARRLEQELSKDEILELYLNNIYFGRGRYGIEEAARDDFGKSAKDITLAEAALVAGRIANPHEFHPRTSMTAALARRAYVLDQMHAKGFLEGAPWAAAKNEPVTLAALADASSDLAPEAVEMAKTVLYQIEPEQARLGGFTVTTSIDSKLQVAARRAVRDALSSYDKRHGLQGVLRPQPTTADKRGKPVLPREAAFDGTPRFEQHRVLTGVVLATDDDAGTFDVRVGSITGTVKLADFERYNVAKLTPSAFAPLGAHVRVSLLATIPLAPGSPEGTAPLAKTPLRLESGPEGALVAVDVRTRHILALVGSYEGQAGALDRATRSRRQPGSTFKPIVYSYAIHSRRFTPATLVDPSPEVFEGGYHPSNFEGWTGSDRLRLREALANSVNVAAVRVLRDVGPANVVSWARALGIESPMKPDLSLALGSYEVRPLELAGAYATFGAGGVYDEPQLVVRIVGPDGKDVTLPERPPARRILDEAEAYVVTSMLTSVIDHGTGARAKSLGRPLAGKTGTSNGPKDAWFAGYSTDLAAVVWVGYDDGKMLGAAEQGAITALPAWIAFMKVATEGTPRVDFPRPPGVATVSIDRRTGALPYADDPDVLDEVFLTGSEPTAVAAPPSPERVNEGGIASGAPPR
ncbi:MAG: PBP1A family penicillin-binding protein [Myxococcota bacterium]|nr:PBP1A family penicillin-binding protein [Myxococcota bacterium]